MSDTRDPIVGVVMGSDSDWPTMTPAAEALAEFDVPYEVHVLSAHRTPRRMLDYAEAAATARARTSVRSVPSAVT
jgi:5-(carboxyamino)imidazole ribonucleotide mutase